MVLFLPFFHYQFLYIDPVPSPIRIPLLATHFIVLICNCFFACKKQPRGLSTDTLPPDPSDVSPCHIGELCPLESLVETQAGIVGGCEEQDTGCS